MSYDNTVTAADLIDILECCAANTHTPLDELRIAVADLNRYAHWMGSYQTEEVEDGWIVTLNAGI